MSERMLTILFGLSLLGMFAGMVIAGSMVDGTTTLFGIVVGGVCGTIAVQTSNDWYNNYYIEDDD